MRVHQTTHTGTHNMHKENKTKLFIFVSSFTQSVTYVMVLFIIKFHYEAWWIFSFICNSNCF